MIFSGFVFQCDDLLQFQLKLRMELSKWTLCVLIFNIQVISNKNLVTGDTLGAEIIRWFMNTTVF